MENENNIQAAVSPVDVFSPDSPTITGFLNSIINLGENGVFSEPTCPFCLSANRAKAELVAKQGDKHDAKLPKSISDLFVANGESISEDVVRNHIKQHMGRGEVELRKVEYITRLGILNSHDMSTLDRIKIALAAIMERIVAIGELEPDARTSKNKVEDLKTSQVSELTKTMCKLLQLRASILGEMRGNGEIISIPKDKFKSAFDKVFAKVATENERALVIALLNELTSVDES